MRNDVELQIPILSVCAHFFFYFGFCLVWIFEKSFGFVLGQNGFARKLECVGCQLRIERSVGGKKKGAGEKCGIFWPIGKNVCDLGPPIFVCTFGVLENRFLFLFSRFN